MVIGKVPIQHARASKGRMSLIKIQNFTVYKRQSFFRILYGALLAIIGIVMIAINPIELITNHILTIREGSFLYHVWEDLPYEICTETWVYNYTNVPEYLSGEDKVLKLQEIGPFVYREVRTNKNITIDSDRGVMTFNPNIELEFIREKSIADPKDVELYMPNVAVIAMSTLFADKLSYFINSGVYYSIKTIGSQLFRKMTADEILWGYDDNIVKVVNKLLPGWIDFQKLGILDRIYAKKHDEIEVELGDISKKFTLNEWNGSPGIIEQGFKDLNTSTTCNRIKGVYEGLLYAPNMPTDKVIEIHRRAACRILPFHFQKQTDEKFGFNYYRYTIDRTAYDNSSEYVCKCKYNCLPNGFVDIGNCYYGFPIVLSQPHMLDADPVQRSYYEGMNPDPEKHVSYLNIVPSIGVPLSLQISMQVNLAVRMSEGNPITEPIKDKILPILWFSLSCKSPPPKILTLLNLRFKIGPPLLITVEILLLIIGAVLGIHGFYRIYKPRYRLVEYNPSHTELQEGDYKNNAFIRNDKAYKDEPSENCTITLLSTQLPD
ncbi:scavenger receptor class B member 1-like [Galleria mellonella]|uniref:Scavenger receptor class B member 1-like n=1 Tax=Galleria mellonella TaxID=7137 RepID=A0A6J1WV60_GALME|nr:scavenger receptor class B member 1-like [Galleria mellonella]XP_026759660.2 scavenger receptor class B member 1-like [Galleria mellonella]XP_031765822.2 scavenger receptor class B member 1-like [Galleria mellonella]XP_031765844.2 scavenger receptor class B member 1-like [Galleria mellonella]XP_052758133.1 scavenger receptor class B member 1-like [Galleria mellonella]